MKTEKLTKVHTQFEYLVQDNSIFKIFFRKSEHLTSVPRVGDDIAVEGDVFQSVKVISVMRDHNHATDSEEIYLNAFCELNIITELFGNPSNDDTNWCNAAISEIKYWESDDWKCEIFRVANEKVYDSNVKNEIIWKNCMS